MAAYEEVLRLALSEQLSRSLPHALSLANAANAPTLATWLRLELVGYVAGNPALTDAAIVPEYRSEPGMAGQTEVPVLTFDRAEFTRCVGLLRKVEKEERLP